MVYNHTLGAHEQRCYPYPVHPYKHVHRLPTNNAFPRSPTKGRNKHIVLGQVGIRCRHCSHGHVCRRQKGSTYIPGDSSWYLPWIVKYECDAHTAPENPESIKMLFTSLLTSKVASSGAGRPYSAQSIKKLGLVFIEVGIFCQLV
jgi:hypothetical protein